MHYTKVIIKQFMANTHTSRIITALKPHFDTGTVCKVKSHSWVLQLDPV